MFNDYNPRIHALTRGGAIVQINDVLRRMGHGGGRASMRSFLTEADAFFITVDYGNDDVPDFVYITKSSNGSVFMGWYNGDKVFPSCSFCLHGDERVGEFTDKLIDLLSCRNKILFPEQKFCHDACSARELIDQMDETDVCDMLKAAGIDADSNFVDLDKDEADTTILSRKKTAGNGTLESINIATGRHSGWNAKPLRVMVQHIVGEKNDVLKSIKYFDDDLLVDELINHIRDTTTRFRNAAREL